MIYVFGVLYLLASMYWAVYAYHYLDDRSKLRRILSAWNHFLLWPILVTYGLGVHTAETLRK